MSLATLAGRWIDRFKINALDCQRREGQVVWIKCRRRRARWLIPAANAFFRVAGNPVTVIPNLRDWQEWEVESFRLVHGPKSHAQAVGRRAVETEALSGESLCQALSQRRLTAAMMSAAGLELRQAHRQMTAYFEGPWSHGDPHLGNFLFEPTTSRCRLIDFEARHLRQLTAVERHVEDLLVPLLDLSSRCEKEQWLPFSLSFLSAYDDPEKIEALRPRLELPSGMARLWWAIRTNYCPRSLLRRRLTRLRHALETGALKPLAALPENR